MLSANTIKRLEGIEKSSKQGHKVKDLYRMLIKHEDLWVQAYLNIEGNKGALTKGVNDDTIDGFSKGKVKEIVENLYQKTYKPQPVRRTYIPKSNGKSRPLGIPCATDKLVQEAVRIILDAMYEPVFSENSHGFRSGLSCHTALVQIAQQWRGVKWTVEFDIKGYFDNINHEMLLEILSKRIDDKRFLCLIKLMLEAGYLDEWKFHNTYSGTPQGGIISPMLANIYLHELDTYMEDRIVNFNKGKERTGKNDLQIQKRLEVIKEAPKEEKKRLLKEIKAIKIANAKIPNKNPMDSNFRRMRYCRYADDFIIGIAGTREEAEKIKTDVEQFIHELDLEVSQEKTKIVHNKEKFRFLGYDILIDNSVKWAKVTSRGRTFLKRTISGGKDVRLEVPKEKLRKFAKDRGYGDIDELKSQARAYLIDSDPVEIFSTYNAELRGVMNYYGLAHDAKRKLGKLAYLAQASLAKTLARKYRISVKKCFGKFNISGHKGLAYRYKVKGKERMVKLTLTKDMLTRMEYVKKVTECSDIMPNTLKYTARTSLLDRLNAEKCELCGKEDVKIEIHHIRKMADIEKGEEIWKQTMRARRRKTLAVCEDCHLKIHQKRRKTQ